MEGLSLSIAEEVEPFGIRITIVEPGGFRTGLLDAGSVKCAENSIEDYSAQGGTREMWSAYRGAQPGDPAKLGKALVEVARMERPPKLFVAGSDALAIITPAVESRLEDMRRHEALSKSTDWVASLERA